VDASRRIIELFEFLRLKDAVAFRVKLYPRNYSVATTSREIFTVLRYRLLNFRQINVPLRLPTLRVSRILEIKLDEKELREEKKRSVKMTISTAKYSALVDYQFVFADEVT